MSTTHRPGDLLRAKAAAAAAQSKWFGARADLVAWAREHVGPVTEDFATITSALTDNVVQARWLWFIAKARVRMVRAGQQRAAEQNWKQDKARRRNARQNPRMVSAADGPRGCGDPRGRRRRRQPGWRAA